MYIMSDTAAQTVLHGNTGFHSNRGFPTRALQEGVLLSLFLDRDRQEQLLASLDSSLKVRYLHV